MKKEQAIKILTEQKAKIENRQVKAETWVKATNENLRRIFPESWETKAKSLKDIGFYPYYNNDPFRKEEKYKNGVTEACRFMDEYISIIQRYGMEKAGKVDHPIMALITNGYFYGALVILMGAAFSFGLSFGGFKYDKEKNDMYDEIKKLRNDVRSKDAKIKNLNSEISQMSKQMNQPAQ